MRWTTGLLSAGLVLLVGACGDSGTALTKTEFLAQGNQICADHEQNIKSAAESAFTEKGKIPTPDQVSDFASKTVAPEVQKQLDELKKLKPPSKDKSRVDQILSEGKKGVDETRRDPTSIQTKESSPFVNYEELADAYGLKACGDSSANTRALLSGVSKS